MQVAVLGVGKMGRIIMEKLMADGHQVAIWNRSRETLEALKVEKADLIIKNKLILMHAIEESHEALMKPRIYWSMLPAGEPTNKILETLLGIVEPGDIVIDGGNSHYTDTQKWFEEYSKKGVKFLGIGVSGGLHGLENGLCLMAGGTNDAYEYVRQILDSLIKPNGGHAYVGDGGAGHYVKMVHNGIEYGMMQAIAEGYGILAKSTYHFNLSNISNVFLEGSIVSSFLIWNAREALRKDPMLSGQSGRIGSTGEAKWALEEALALHVPVPVLDQSVQFRNRSEYDKAVQDTFASKLIQALRLEFGGHEQPRETEKTTS